MAARYDIETRADVRLRRVFQQTGVTDLTGWGARLRVARQVNGELLAEMGDTVTVDPDGTVSVSVAPGTWYVGTYWWVLDLIDLDGELVPLVYGDLLVTGVFPS